MRLGGNCLQILDKHKFAGVPVLPNHIVLFPCTWVLFHSSDVEDVSKTSSIQDHGLDRINKQ